MNKDQRIKTMIVGLINSDLGLTKNQIINVISRLDKISKTDVRRVYELVKKGMI